ncbi:MAG: DUF2301 domain-containing membrane protein [Cyanothece sp. SIO2G6]|nr:DUF2301 domain-containing membrane protein [Cyanothece sp. SIO2G6]
MDIANPSDLNSASAVPVVYQGQFGDFTITPGDRREVVIYRSGLGLAALCLAVGAAILAWFDLSPTTLLGLTGLYTLFSLGLGVSLWTIHIYLIPLHRTLQLFWGIGTLCSLVLLSRPEPLMITIYQTPQVVLGIGFMFAALTGIFIKEAFCFNRLEAKGLTVLTPLVLLGHLTQLVPDSGIVYAIDLAAVLMVIFVLRKAFQPIPQDIGDKSVFAYLKQQRSQSQ